MAKPRLEIDPEAFDAGAIDPELVAQIDWLRKEHRQRPDPWSLPIDKVRQARKEGKGIFLRRPVAGLHFFQKGVTGCSFGVGGRPAGRQDEEEIHSAVVVPGLGNKALRQYAGHFNALRFIEKPQ